MKWTKRWDCQWAMDSMNSRSNRYAFETATPEDSADILDILEDIDLEGKISLIFTRRPDPYSSFKREGREVDIIVSRDTRLGRLTSVAAASINTMFLNGEPRDIGYLFALRVRKEYRRRYRILPEGFDYLFRLHKDKDIPFYLTTILEQNTIAQRLLEKQRESMPVYEYLGDYETYALATGKREKKIPGFHFKKAGGSDLHALVEFLSDQGRAFQFFPVLEEADLADTSSHVRFNDFYLLYNNNEIVAAGAVWDQRDYKQYILSKYGGILRILYPFSFVFPLFGYPTLARPGSILDFCTLSFWAIRSNRAEYLECFLRHISDITRQYSYFVIGVAACHPLRELLHKRPHLIYKSRMYLVYQRNNELEIQKVDRARIPYLEIGRL